MSRLQAPLEHETLSISGDVLMRAEVDLQLRDAAGGWQKQTFRYDSGADITAMPAWRAEALGLPMPQAGVTLPVNTAIGQVTMLVRSGLLRMKVDGMDQTEYVVPCHFR